MASQAQIEANRKNALTSTGPKSTPGKCNSRANSFDGMVVDQVTEAREDWEHSRRVEAIARAEGLRKRPALVSAKLQETRQGVEWMDADRDVGLDLLGTPEHDPKPGLTPLDPPDGAGGVPAPRPKRRERLRA